MSDESGSKLFEHQVALSILSAFSQHHRPDEVWFIWLPGFIFSDAFDGSDESLGNWPETG